MYITSITPNRMYKSSLMFGKNFSKREINSSKNLLLGHSISIDSNGNCLFDNKKISPENLSKALEAIENEKNNLAPRNMSAQEVLWPFPRKTYLDGIISGIFSHETMNDTKKEKTSVPASVKVNKTFLKQYTYDKIGGMNEIIKDIREVVEFPIKYPELFKHLKMKTNRNILFFGPPGCGKTMLAKTIANETNANLFMINGSELQSKWHGETQERLRKVFKMAEKSEPAIIFIDEFDSLGTQRGTEAFHGIKNDETNQLLTLIDGLKSKNKNVFVIAATNFPDLLDSAAIRKGRFDKHIKISMPDKNGVLEILKVKIKNKPVSDDINWDDVANQCFSLKMSGAEIEALINDACMDLIKNEVNNKNFDIEDLSSVKLKQENINFALNKFKDYKELVEKRIKNDIV